MKVKYPTSESYTPRDISHTLECRVTDDRSFAYSPARMAAASKLSDDNVVNSIIDTINLIRNNSEALVSKIFFSFISSRTNVFTTRIWATVIFPELKM